MSSGIAYVNGQYTWRRSASVGIEDRGYQFADGVYEVIAVVGGKFVDEDAHLQRLQRSLAALQIAPPVADNVLSMLMRQVVVRNRLRDAAVYVQITRGEARRDFPFPKATKPALVITASRFPHPSVEAVTKGVKVISIPDLRWKRCDIKSVALLASVLGKQQAREAGAYEAWQVDADGMVTEGTSTNAWIVTPQRVVVTRHADNAILRGITRDHLLGTLTRLGYTFQERAFSLDEAKHASEAFLSSTTTYLLPIVQIDDAVIGQGVPGEIAQQVRQAYAADIHDGVL